MGPILLLLLSCAARDGAVRGGAPADPAQLASFELAWSAIGEAYPDPAMKGLDWQGLHDELLPKAQAARTNAETRIVIQKLLDALGDSHFQVFPAALTAPSEVAPPPSEVAPPPSEVAPPPPVAPPPVAPPPPDAPAPSANEAPQSPPVALGGPGDAGFELRFVEDQLVLTRVRPGGPADRAGLKVGQPVISADGWLTADWVKSVDYGVEERLLPTMRGLAVASADEGTAGQVMSLTVATLEGPRTVQLTHEPSPGEIAALGLMPPMAAWLESRLVPGDVGVIHFNVFMPSVGPAFTAAVESLKAQGARAVVVDVRGNPGGVAVMAGNLAGHFVGKSKLSLGRMVGRDLDLQLLIRPRPAAQRIDGPLAVIIDELSMSTSEIFAAGLQGLKLARVFGAPTPGWALPSMVRELPNGDRLQLVFSFLYGPDGQPVEARGVTPDELTPHTLAALGKGVDQAEQAAITWARRALEETP
jgi:carboxyl-terminal processing protease